jgi:dihydroceramide fatty acyl 2-hydroxylase
MESKRSELLRASPRMFENDILDRFSRVHHMVPLVLFLPAIAIFLYLGFDKVGTGETLLLAIGGYLFWSLSEYWIHRAIFHWEPEAGWGAKLHWMIHGVHHDHPNDPLRLVMPPAASIPLATLFVLAFVLIIGTPEAWPFAGGFLAGYLIYDMVHYALHHHRPKTRFGRWLRELHMRHHFQDDTTGYGIAAPYWDWVFRTKVDRARRAAPAPRED